MAEPLSVNDLAVSGRGGRALLQIDRLDLAAGQSLGVTGPSGAGKSTFLYAIAGLIEGAKGQVHWGETELLGLSSDGRGAFRAGHMGFVFQDFLLLEELTGFENAALPALFAPRPRRRTIRDRARAGLDRLGISDPDRGVDSYSGGERQRVGIARALANDAGILLADEPTASLHRDAADALIADLATMTGDKTLVVVSHDRALLDRMDRVITIADGMPA